MEVDEDMIHQGLRKETTKVGTPTSKMTIDYAFLKELWNNEPLSVRQKSPTNQFIEFALSRSGLPMVQFPNEDTDVNARYAAVVNVLRTRFAKRLNKIKKAGNEKRAGQDMHEIMFSLEGEDILIDLEKYLEPEGLPLSQESGTSVRSTQLSEIEIEVPMPPVPPRKNLEDCHPNYQRDKMTELYHLSLEKSREWGMDPIKTFCKLGARYAHQTDRSLEGTFRKIAEGNYKVPAELPMEEAVFLKSNFIKTQRKWKDFRLFMKDYVSMPTDEELSKYTDKLTPTFIPFKNGYRINLKEGIEKRLQRMPKEVNFRIDFRKSI